MVLPFITFIIAPNDGDDDDDGRMMVANLNS